MTTKDDKGHAACKAENIGPRAALLAILGCSHGSLSIVMADDDGNALAVLPMSQAEALQTATTIINAVLTAGAFTAHEVRQAETPAESSADNIGETKGTA